MNGRGRAAALALAGGLALAPGDARACGWDWESYHAEERSLPCVYDALLGFWPKHTDAYHERRIEAADAGLRWIPGWTDGLDAKGNSLLALGRFAEAELVMNQRHTIAPAAYAGHANLGTLYTFTGQFDAALEHIDAAMAIEPQAHFGREGYHRALVVFLGRVTADPDVAHQENFLGIELDDRQRRRGSKQTFEALGLREDGFDALVAMLTVYGADELAEIYLTLGELLAARGHRRLAYTAYRRARELGHVRSGELRKWMRWITDDLAAERRAEKRPRDREDYRGISERYLATRKRASSFQADWAEWEREQLDAGLAIWTRAGLDDIYTRMNQKRRRCDAPGIIRDDRAPLADEDRPGEDDLDEDGPDEDDPDEDPER
jgi:tetratricopeptide (TPR) repeat protein